MTHDTYPRQPEWRTGEVAPQDIAYVREALGGVPLLGQAFHSLGSELPPGSSRTIYSLPVNQPPRDSLDAMVHGARTAAWMIDSEGITDIDPRKMPLVLRSDEAPEQFQPSSLPDRVTTEMSPDSPIGYIRVEHTNAGLIASVGALDPGTQAHYAITLD
jgi:hypothetical protein